MYRIDRNNHFENEKNSTVYTPDSVSQFIYTTLHKHIKMGIVFDPCVGKGSLLNPWENNKKFKVLGMDIEDQNYPKTWEFNYLELKKESPLFLKKRPSLIIMNPPFNIDKKTKEYIKNHYGGRPLLSEVFLQKTIELFGKDVPIVMFSPYGFRLNQKINGKRLAKFKSGEYPEICSIISLPLNIFENVLFHAEILIFNVKGIKGHYFYA